jgi:hypothetical protein
VSQRIQWQFENDIFQVDAIMTYLKASLNKRQEDAAKTFAPIDFSQIKSTITKLKSALTSINVLNTQLVKRNNSLTLQLSMVPANVREQITQAILSHSPFATNQREHPHCLVSDKETKYVFRPSDPKDPMAEELQRGNPFSSVQHLLDEVQEAMNIIRNYDSSRGVDERIDGVEQGPDVQTAMDNGEQKGANKRSHDTMIVPGHKVHSSRIESSSSAANVANVPLLQSVVPTAKNIRTRTIQDVAVPANQSSSSIPVAQATTATARMIHVLDPTAADASRLVALATPLNPAFPRMPTTSIRSGIAPSAYLAEPEHPFSPAFRRQNLRYDVSRSSEVLSQDDFYGTPRDSYSYCNTHFAKGKGKGKPPKGKGTRNANPKVWDETQTIIPEFGEKLGIEFYTLNSLPTEACQYRVGSARAFETSSVPGQGQLLQHMEMQQIRMRAHPTDFGPDGQVTAQVVANYRRAQLAIYDVRRSVQRFVIIDENNQPVDLNGNSVQGRLPADPYHLMEDDMKMHLGDFWRVLRNRPSTSPLKSSSFDVEYIPNNTYSYYQVKKTLAQVAKVQIKPSRYWNELPAQGISDDIIYSLSEYWPSIPHNVNIVYDNQQLGLDAYRMREQKRTKFSPGPGIRPYWVHDHAHTLEYLLATGAIANLEQITLEDYMTRVHEMDMLLTDHIANWPFLAAQRLLKLQLSRLRVIKQALTTSLEGHPLHDNNLPGLNNPDPNMDHHPSNPVRNEDGAATAAEEINLRLWQSGATDGDNSQSEIRPG